MKKIKKSRTSAVPFFGSTIHVLGSGGCRDLGWTSKKAQKNLEKNGDFKSLSGFRDRLPPVSVRERGVNALQAAGAFNSIATRNNKTCDHELMQRCRTSYQLACNGDMVHFKLGDNDPSKDKVSLYFIACASQIPIERLLQGRLDDEDWPDLTRGVGQLSGLQLIIG